jgi:hypothetical protein
MNTGNTRSEYPFQIMPWAFRDDMPSAVELWEGQLSLWIQEDIARAIALTNRTDYPEANVTNVPVKRLIRMAVLPDYVGVTGKGGIDTDAPRTGGGGMDTARPNWAGAGGGAAGPMMGPGAAYGSGMGAVDVMGGGAAPPLPGAGMGGPQAGPAVAPSVPGAKLPDDFTSSSTGRRSNEVYDIRHVWLSVVLDAKAMPQFFDNLAKINFMTVLKMSIEDVDEYAELKNGYVYGREDCVRADILIETVWLRRWTAPMMPGPVATALGVASAAGTPGAMNVAP